MSAALSPGPVKVTRPAPVKVTVGAFGDNLATIERKEVGVCMPQCLHYYGFTKVFVVSHDNCFSHETRRSWVELGDKYSFALMLFLQFYFVGPRMYLETLRCCHWERWRNCMSVRGAYPDHLAYTAKMGLVKSV